MFTKPCNVSFSIAENEDCELAVYGYICRSGVRRHKTRIRIELMGLYHWGKRQAKSFRDSHRN